MAERRFALFTHDAYGLGHVRRSSRILRELAANEARIVIRDHIADLPSVMAAADLVVAMGGYNTSAEILAVGARAVIVPRGWRSGEHGNRGATGIDEEQLVRAEGLTRLG